MSRCSRRSVERARSERDAGWCDKSNGRAPAPPSAATNLGRCVTTALDATSRSGAPHSASSSLAVARIAAPSDVAAAGSAGWTSGSADRPKSETTTSERAGWSTSDTSGGDSHGAAGPPPGRTVRDASRGVPSSKTGATCLCCGSAAEAAGAARPAAGRRSRESHARQPVGRGGVGAGDASAGSGREARTDRWFSTTWRLRMPSRKRSLRSPPRWLPSSRLNIGLFARSSSVSGS